MDKKVFKVGPHFCAAKIRFLLSESFSKFEKPPWKSLGCATHDDPDTWTCQNAKRSQWNLQKCPDILISQNASKKMVKIFKCIPSCQRLTIESAKLIELFYWTWIVRGLDFAKYKISFDVVLGCFETTFCQSQ